MLVENPKKRKGQNEEEINTPLDGNQEAYAFGIPDILIRFPGRIVKVSAWLISEAIGRYYYVVTGAMKRDLNEHVVVENRLSAVSFSDKYPGTIKGCVL